jgi:hypothetical protein
LYNCGLVVDVDVSEIEVEDSIAFASSFGESDSKWQNLSTKGTFSKAIA